MKKHTTFVGLDVHKDSIDVALADVGRDGDVRFYGTISGDLESLHKVVRKLQSTGSELRFAYEAGPCGYEIYRSLTNQGFDCIVVAPSERFRARSTNHKFEFCRPDPNMPLLLPTVCDRGVKKNANGYTETWNDFKLHIDVNDCGLPLSAVLTSASMHDSQVAIPLMKLTSSKVTYYYDLMDAAYDAAQVWDQSKELGHVPIIDRNPRGKEIAPMAPHEAQRYNERTASERCNSRLKEDFGGRNVMVRGADKVMTHLMFGMLALFADQLLKVTGC